MISLTVVQASKVNRIWHQARRCLGLENLPKTTVDRSCLKVSPSALRTLIVGLRLGFGSGFIAGRVGHIDMRGTMRILSHPTRRFASITGSLKSSVRVATVKIRLPGGPS